MSAITCTLCWRRDNLTEAQRNDPANQITKFGPLCDTHQAQMDEAWESFATVAFGPIHPQASEGDR